MNKSIRIRASGVIVGLICLTLMASSSAPDALNVQWHVFAGGGVVSSSGLELNSCIGQPVTEIVASGAEDLQSGYIVLLEDYTYLPLVIR